MNVYRVEYETRWADDYWEEMETRVSAKDAEAAIAKAKKLTFKETYKGDDGKVYKRIAFKLQAVNLLTDYQ